jgi:hypothetical protein
LSDTASPAGLSASPGPYRLDQPITPDDNIDPALLVDEMDGEHSVRSRSSSDPQGLMDDSDPWVDGAKRRTQPELVQLQKGERKQYPLDEMGERGEVSGSRSCEAEPEPATGLGLALFSVANASSPSGRTVESQPERQPAGSTTPSPNNTSTSKTASSTGEHSHQYMEHALEVIAERREVYASEGVSIPEGTTLFETEYRIWSLHPGLLTSHCSWCLDSPALRSMRLGGPDQTPRAFITCSRCEMMTYCSAVSLLFISTSICIVLVSGVGERS